jgi:hypothetical protein
VSLGDRYSPIAAWFARKHGRLLLEVPEIERVNPAGCRSLFFVGEPGSFMLDRLRILAGQIRVSWGIATARDEPGLTFALARMEAGARVAWPADALLALENEVLEERRHRAALPRPRDPGLVRSWLREHFWDALSILAHGEPGHARCGPLVLCGSLPGGERDLHSRPIDGCNALGPIARCRRSREDSQLLMSFADLPARVVLLLTCHGFSLGGELYPSDLSSVLTISEGFPAAFLSTSLAVSLSQTDLRMAAALHGAGVVPGQIARLLNDCYKARKGVRPYLLFGDPGGPVPRRTAWPGTGKLPLPTRKGVLLARPPAGSRGRVLAATVTEGAPPEMLHGHQSLVILPRSDLCVEVGVEDRTDSVEALAAWLRETVERLQYAAALERAIARAIVRPLAEEPRGSFCLEEISEIRRQTSALAQLALATVQKCRARGVWEPQLDELQISTCKGLLTWDLLAGNLFCEVLWQKDLGDLLADGSELVSTVQLGPPSPCMLAADRHTVIETVERLPGFGEGRLIRRECDICGPSDLWLERGTRLRLHTRGEIRPGGSLDIGVEISGGPPPGREPVGGILIVLLVEKLTRRHLFRSLVPASRPPSRHTFQATLPEDLLLETHRAFAVHLDRAHWALASVPLHAIWPARRAGECSGGLVSPTGFEPVLPP